MIFKFRSDHLEGIMPKILKYINGREDWFVVDIRVAKRFRTLPQNKYYWGVVIAIIADHTGYTPDETHQLMARKFLSYESTGNTFVKSTTKLNTKEFSDYIELIRVWAQDMLLHIPLPNEIDEETYMNLLNLDENR